jgi:hypothetical protein
MEIVREPNVEIKFFKNDSELEFVSRTGTVVYIEVL